MDKQNKFKELFDKLVNRETIAYAITGVLTTAVNFIALKLLTYLHLDILISNGLAWAVAVTFAYITNKWNVFQSKSDSFKDEMSKILKFFAARLLSLGVEELGMLIFVKWLGANLWVIKCLLAVIVIILNYIFSKLYIFNKKKTA